MLSPALDNAASSERWHQGHYRFSYDTDAAGTLISASGYHQDVALKHYLPHSQP
jgi:hypothetical protein